MSELDHWHNLTVVELLRKNGPMSHKELTDKMSVNWNELQQIIRELRNRNKVRIRIDKRYEVIKDD